MPRFFDADTRGPRGGWSYPVGGQTITKWSEGEILDEMERWERNQPSPRSRQQLQADLWQYLCAREPERCGGAAAVSLGGSVAASPIPAEITKEMQGPPIWTFLNTLAAQWTESLHPYFMDTLNAIIVLLVCPLCREEWRRILREIPPATLDSRFKICSWVNVAHNQVNERIGKVQFPYREMVRQYGAPTA